MSEELLPLPEGEPEEEEEEVCDEEDDDETTGDYKDDEADVPAEEDEAEEPCELDYDPDAPPARAAPRLRKRELTTPDYSAVPMLTRDD